jgi:phage terminase small subunit
MPAKKKPIEELIEKGTYRKARHRGRIEGLDVQILTKPPELPSTITSKKAKAAWEQIVPRLTESGRIAAEDLPSLELAFRAFQIAHALLDTMGEVDPIQETGKMRMLSSIANSNANVFTEILLKFGVTPKGREGIIETLAKDATKKKPSLIDQLTQDMME